MLSVFGFVAFVVHASIFCLRFSQKQSANQPKKIQGNGLLLNIKAHAKIQALLKEKNFTRKSHLRPSCTKPFKYPYPTTNGFHVLTPPCLRKFQNALPPPMPSEFHNREPPTPLQNFHLFLSIFDLATPICSLNLAIKINTTYSNFTPLCFLVLF